MLAGMAVVLVKVGMALVVAHLAENPLIL